jgi:hypothetical protein
MGMRNTLAIVVLGGCVTSPQVTMPMDAAPQTVGDMAQATDLAGKEMSAIPDMEPPLPDLSMTPDLTMAAGCGPNQIMAAGQCWDPHTAQECAALSRQYIGVNLMYGYCGACVAPAQPFFGYCAAPSCANTAGSLGALCQALGRGCTGTGATATCNGCLNGAATLDPMTQACVPTNCSARSDCPELAGYYCTQLNASDMPQCRKRPCPLGQSWNRTSTQACTACGACGGAGNEWPVTDSQGVCYCNAGPGQFYNHIGALASVEDCDYDHDGWIKKEVQDELLRATGTGGNTDYTVLFNVQCVVPVFTSVELRNEWYTRPNGSAQTKTLSLTDIGVSSSGVPMYEDTGNDDGTNPWLAYGGRTLDARMVNSLTKTCSTKLSDLNRNGVDDYQESQESSTPMAGFSWTKPYQRLTYFMEFYQAHFESAGTITNVTPCDGCISVPGITGKLVIEERSRCDPTFSTKLTSATNEYWTECTRRRDANYDSTKPDGELGYDFGQYDCSSTTGACSEAPPISGPSQDGSLPQHGLCNGGVAGTAWRGMTAYSQFMCAHFNSTPPTQPKHNDILTTDVETLSSPNAPWEAFSCGLTPPGAPPDAGVGEESETFVCNESTLSAPGNDTVAWVMRRYTGAYPTPSPYPAYPGGCIDEATEWPQLCTSDPADAVGNVKASGLIECPPACVPDELHQGNGLALCFHRTLASFGTGSTWQFSGNSMSGDGGVTGYLMSGDARFVHTPNVLNSGNCNPNGTPTDNNHCLRLQ